MNVNEQAKKFCSELGVRIEAVESKLKGASGYHKQRYFSPVLCDPKEPPPVHYIGFYFAAISLALEGAENILEIGVGIGQSTYLLSLLFPDAMVYTLDVPSGDKQYKTNAHRAYMDVAGETMKKNLDRPNIKFIQSNSFFLPALGLPGKFDLIWVDGGHYFPAVAWDVMFAYDHIREGGFVLIDDYSNTVPRAFHPDVGKTVDYVGERISETIKFLPCRSDGQTGTIAWFKKEKKK